MKKLVLVVAMFMFVCGGSFLEGAEFCGSCDSPDRNQCDSCQ